jgi:ABC-type Mn2+/Zn2+ transport system permease subunit
MNGHPRTVAGHVVGFVARTERRRLLVVGGVPILFVLLLETAANYGVLVLLLAAGLAAVLYTRSTAQQTIAASSYGVGVLLLGLYLLELYWNGARGSTEPLVGTATRLLWLAVTGTVLTGLGLWLRRVDL